MKRSLTRSARLDGVAYRLLGAGLGQGLAYYDLSEQGYYQSVIVSRGSYGFLYGIDWSRRVIARYQYSRFFYLYVMVGVSFLRVSGRVFLEGVYSRRTISLLYVG